MKADYTFTTNDEKQQYKNTKIALKEIATENLILEYRVRVRDGFNEFFSQNAKKLSNLIVEELASRGITEYQDIFGTLKIRKWTY